MDCRFIGLPKGGPMGHLAIKRTQSELRKLHAVSISRNTRTGIRGRRSRGRGGDCACRLTFIDPNHRGIDAFLKRVGLFNLGSDFFFDKVQNFPVYEFDGLQLLLETQLQL